MVYRLGTSYILNVITEKQEKIEEKETGKLRLSS